MSVVTVAITGHLLTPDGVAPSGGRIVAELSQAGSTLNGSESVRVASRVTVDLTTGGVVPTLALVPNDAITPSGTYYKVTLYVDHANGKRHAWSEKWQLTSGDLTLDLGAVPRLDVIPGVAVSVSADVAAAAAIASASASASAASAAAAAAAVSAAAVPGSASLVTATGSTTARTLGDIAARPNAPVQTWDVADSTARLALVPVSTDLGRVCRQTNDGSLWACVGYAPAAWRRMDPAALDGYSVTASGTGGATKTLADHTADLQRLDSDWYVDSINGNDSNSGRSPDAALLTIAALVAKPLKDGAVIRLARGSKWRESLYVPGIYTASGAITAKRTRVLAYGAGARPMFDCSDVVAAGSFTKTGGRTNVYQFAAPVQVPDSRSPNPNKAKYRVWENDVSLAWAADVAACDATPGTFTSSVATAAQSTGTDTIYVHPFGNTNPISDGKTYEVPVRCWGLNGGQFTSETVRIIEIGGVQSRRHFHDDGGILSCDTVSDCVSDSGGDTDYGPSHSFWSNGDTFDCIAIGLINPFIAYQSTSYPGTRYVRCHAVGRGSYTSGTLGISYGFYTHSNVGQAVKRAIFEDCWATNISAGWGGTDVENWILKNCQGRKIDFIFRGGTKSGSGATTVQLLGGTFVLSTTTAQNGILVFGSSYVSTANRTILRGVRMVAKSLANNWMLECDAGTLDVKNCSLIFFDNAVAGANRRLYNVAQAGVAVVFGNNLVLNADTSTSDSARAYGAGATISGGNNVYQGDCNFNLAGTSYANLAAFQAAGKDAGSVTTAQTFVGQLRNGDTRLGDAASAWTLQAGADLDGDNEEVWMPLFVAACQP